MELRFKHQDAQRVVVLILLLGHLARNLSKKDTQHIRLLPCKQPNALLTLNLLQINSLGVYFNNLLILNAVLLTVRVLLSVLVHSLNHLWWK